MSRKAHGDLQRQLVILQKNLAALEEQKAKMGLDVTTRVLNEIEDTQRAIAEIETRLTRSDFSAAGDFLSVRLQRIRHNLPQPTYNTFVGMKTELDTILRLLSPSSRHFLVTVDGVGGTGKSALALEAAYRYVRECDQFREEERFDAIIWTSAKTSLLTANGILTRPRAARTLEDIYTTIAVVLGCENITRAYRDEQDDLVRRALVQQRTLLIVDNLETVDDERVNAFLRELPAPTKAIVTTRHRIDVAYPIRLVGMSEDEGLALIAHECEKHGVILTDEEAEKLYRRTGGVPLSVVWSIARIGYGFDVREVLRQLSEPTGDIARFCFEDMITQIQNTDAHKLIMALALFETGASREGLGYVAGLSADIISRDEGLVRLERLSLVNKRWDRFSILPLTRSFVERELSKERSFLAEARKRWVKWAIELMELYTPLGSLDDSNYAVLDQEYENVLGAINWCYSSGKWSELASLTSHICLFLYRRGLWQELVETVGQGVEACSKSGDWEKQAWLYLNSVLLHITREELAEAENLLKETARVLERLDEIPDELRESYMYRKTILARQRNDPEFKDLMESNLSLALEMGDVWRTVDLLLELASWTLDNRLFEQCTDYLEQALEFAEQTGEGHLITRVLTGMSTLARESGDRDRARAICEKAAATLTSTWYRDKDTEAYLALESAKVHCELGNQEEALLHAQTALDIFSRLGMQKETAECAALLGKLEDGSE